MRLTDFFRISYSSNSSVKKRKTFEIKEDDNFEVIRLSAPKPKGSKDVNSSVFTGPFDIMLPPGVQPYFNQKIMMSKMLQSLTYKTNALIESPTGSGKFNLLVFCVFEMFYNFFKSIHKLFLGKNFEENLCPNFFLKLILLDFLIKLLPIFYDFSHKFGL